MLDEDVLFFGSLNCLSINLQVNNNTHKKRLALQFANNEPLYENVCDGQDKARLALLRKFIEKLKLGNNQKNNYGLMYDLEFFSFLRKPERIHVDTLTSGYRIIMSLGDKMFTAEDKNITRAVHKCAKYVYPNFISYKNREIPLLKHAVTQTLECTDKMVITVAECKSELRNFRTYIENSKVLLIDLEGDQLGPHGTITFIQINTYFKSTCFLIDIKQIGDDELKNENGWLRRLFESKNHTIVMWGGLQDAANLWASYKIKIECMLDLQVVEVHYREELKSAACYPYYEKFPPGVKQPISLETVYKSFTEEPSLLQFKHNQAKHKTDFHIWNTRPLPKELLHYAAFDVASLRPVLQIFLEKIELFKWGVFESAITKSRLTYEPKVKTCFTCLRTVPLDQFSNNQKKNLSHCKSCDSTGYFESTTVQRVYDKIGTGLDVFDAHPNVKLSQCV